MERALHGSWDFAAASFDPGERSFGLAEGAVDVSHSGGFIDDIRPELDAARARIISGEIRVPVTPEGGVGETGAP
ncbi:MAG TPA: hypothetical protein VK194_01340 [Candidatus Deferrimicrobium sp.]|nr:hypothetical protein [Candidatus Deferrimicrobium sp.]